MMIPPRYTTTDSNGISTTTPSNNKGCCSVSPTSTSTKPMIFDIENDRTASSESTNSEYAKYPKVVAYLGSGEIYILEHFVYSILLI